LEKKREIKNSPYFLDEVIAPGMKKLEQAALGEGNVEKTVRSAIKYKTIKHAVMAAVRYNPKKSVRAVLHFNPVGLTSVAAQKMVSNANVLLNNATKKQRQTAMAAGAGAGAALAVLYFLSPLRSILLTKIANTTLHVPVDLIIITLCASVGYIIWQSLSARVRKQALKKLTAKK